MSSESREGNEKKKKNTKEGSSAKTKTKEGKKEKSTKEGSKTKASSAKKSSAAAEAPSGPKTVPKFRPLCQDENLSVIYELRVNPKQSKKIMASFAFKNLSKEAISELEFTFATTLNVKVADAAALKPTLVLASGETNNHNVIFDVQTILQAQKLSGSISYKVDNKSGKKDFQLMFPVSAFILPIKVSKEEFISILTEGGPYVLSSTSVHVKPEEDFRAFVVSLATLLHVELIIMESAASFYGKSIQGHHIAVYVKQLPSNVISVDLKCTDGQIVNALISEINSFFPRA